MNNGFDPLTLVLLAAAAIIFWRLRAVLGRRTGLERPPLQFPTPLPRESRQAEPEAETTKPAETTPVWHGHAEEGSSLATGLAAIAAKSKGFTTESFLSGAAVAYEMILEAFAKGDRQTLKPLLSKEVFDSFARAIDERLQRGESMSFQFVAMKKTVLEQAALIGNKASIVVRFLSDVIGATTTSDGKVIEGDPRSIREVTDVWTFERDVTSRDPNWRLVATQGNA